MHWFLAQAQAGGEYLLDEEEYGHCVRSLRHAVGDEVHLMDGLGGLFRAEIIAISKKEVRLKALADLAWEKSWPFELHLAIAPTKHIERLEWLLEKAVELGLDGLHPVLCRHSERKQLRQDRLERIALSAAKQSYKALCPKISPLQPFEAVLAQAQASASRAFIGYCVEDLPRLNLAQEAPAQKGEQIWLFIGPEGDFSPIEVEQALGAGLKPMSLGSSRLRTETAGLLACSIWHILYQQNT